MQFSAESFIRNCETFLPVVEMLAKITGSKVVSSIASVLRRATQYPETREQIIEWLKWTPLFGATAGEAGPQLPAEYMEIQEDLEVMRSGCDNYDADEADPTPD